MELEFFGSNCFRIKTKDSSLVIDDNLSSMGKKPVINEKSVAIYSNNDLKTEDSKNAKLVIDMPGEYEIGDVTVKGIQARSHTDEVDQRSATIFQFLYGGQSVTFLGHVHPDISDEVIEKVSGTDVAVIPVGGNGFTLDPVGAVGVIKKLEPSIVIPSQYAIAGLNYEVPANELEEFLKVSGLSYDSETSVYKFGKSSDDVAGSAKLIVMEAK